MAGKERAGKEKGKGAASIPKEKIELVKKLAHEMSKAKTILIASCKNLPSAQFHDIKKKFRGTAKVEFVKKNAFYRAVDETGKGMLQHLKQHALSDFAIFLSEIDAFELSGMLADNQIPSKARAGDIAPEDIEIQPGPTDLVPGPAISELSGVGLKVAVKEGKLEIIKGAVVARKGDKIKDNVASVLGKVGISPMRVGFIPLAAYESKDDKVYANIVVDKPGALEALKDAIKKAFGFAVSIKYVAKDTIKYFLAKASLEEKALEKKLKI